MNARGFLYRKWFLALAVLTVLGLVVVGTNGCRDPNDFKPPPDTAQPPPPPPHLIAPLDSVIYNINGTGVTVYFYWAKIDSAEIYELNYTDTLGHDVYVLADSSPKYIILPRGLYNWRVRAGNGAWSDGYTDWSETWQFKVMNFSKDLQISPPDATVFVTDTFPYGVRLVWHSVGNRLIYTLNIYLDAEPLQQIFLWDTAYSFSVPDSGYYPWYEWQISTFDHHWVYPCSIITWPPRSFIVIRPGNEHLLPALDRKWNSVIIKGRR